MKKIEQISKETILQAINNIRYRIRKNENKKIKIISNEDFLIMRINIDIAIEELCKLNKEWKYKVYTDKEQLRYEKERKKWLKDISEYQVVEKVQH